MSNYIETVVEEFLSKNELSFTLKEQLMFVVAEAMCASNFDSHLRHEANEIISTKSQ